MKNLKKGFTLIELLVVIAIIGILSAVVLASLNTARAKGQDASIKSHINGLRGQAELYYDSNGNSYGVNSTSTAVANVACGTTGMFADATVKSLTKGASTASGQAVNFGGGTGVATICASTVSTWAFGAVLRSDPTLMWCADSTGKSGTTTLPASANAFTGC